MQFTALESAEPEQYPIIPLYLYSSFKKKKLILHSKKTPQPTGLKALVTGHIYQQKHTSTQTMTPQIFLSTAYFHVGLRKSTSGE